MGILAPSIVALFVLLSAADQACSADTTRSCGIARIQSGQICGPTNWLPGVDAPDHAACIAAVQADADCSADFFYYKDDHPNDADHCGCVSLTEVATWASGTDCWDSVNRANDWKVTTYAINNNLIVDDDGMCDGLCSDADFGDANSNCCVARGKF